MRMLPNAILLAASLTASAPGIAQQVAASAADRQLLEDFVRLQDLAFEAAGEAGCSNGGEEAVRALHERYDARLVLLAKWLQKRFSDEDLTSAQAKVHGADTFVRTKPSCPIEPEQIKASEAAYSAALAKLEIEVQSRTSGESR